ncbi:MAG: aminotransferase [Hyphomicrobiaceae bacterium]|jgi:aminotransferase
MSRSLSRRAAVLQQSAIRAMSQACTQAGGINMAQGICDTPVPEVVARGATRAIADGRNIYSRYDGVDELRRALVTKMEHWGGAQYDPDGEVVVTVGATGAFHIACSTLLEAGDEVLLFEPFYGYHVATLRSQELVPVPVLLAAPDWRVSMDALEKAVTKRTRAIVINTPANPCGKVFTRDELTEIGAFAALHDLWIFTDEVYEHFLYDGREHVAPASLPGLRERTVTMSSLSKTLAITGWRIGWMAADARWARAFGPMNDLVYVCPPTPLQLGAAAGLANLGDDYFEGLARDHESKRDRFCEALRHAGLEPLVPEGAYYVLADCASLPGDTGHERAMNLLARCGVAAVPGEAFFSRGQGHGQGHGQGGDLLRFCFGKTDADLDEACTRIAALK